MNGNTKYVFLAANSSLKGQSDFKKFEKARELVRHIERIRDSYSLDLKSEGKAFDDGVLIDIISDGL